MRQRSSFKVTLCALVFGGPLLAEPQVHVASQITWQPDITTVCASAQVTCSADLGDDIFGGLSGLEVGPLAQTFFALSDTGVLYGGTFTRNSARSIVGAEVTRVQKLVFEGGLRPKRKRNRDTEGLALSCDQDIYISAESKTRLLRYTSDQTLAQILTLPTLGPRVPSNTGFEALAMSPDNALVAIAEGSQTIKSPFDVFKRDAQSKWTVVYSLPRHGGFRPVGADFGPDGHLYILSRAFNGFAFASRIDRILFENATPVDHQKIYQSRYGQFDNLEGLAVIRADLDEIRLYAVSDDNFSKLQSTQFVEFVLRE